MATKAQKVRLAVFVIAASCVLVSFILVAAGVQLMRDRDLYYIDFDASVLCDMDEPDAVGRGHPPFPGVPTKCVDAIDILCRIDEFHRR